VVLCYFRSGVQLTAGRQRTRQKSSADLDAQLELEVAEDFLDKAVHIGSFQGFVFRQKIFLGEIDYETLVAQLPAGLRYHPLPEFDTVARDLALVADEETPCGTIIAEMKRACKQLADVELFDIYRSEAIGAGKKSMAFSLPKLPTRTPLHRM